MRQKDRCWVRGVSTGARDPKTSWPSSCDFLGVSERALACVASRCAGRFCESRNSDCSRPSEHPDRCSGQASIQNVLTTPGYRVMPTDSDFLCPVLDSQGPSTHPGG